MERIIIIIHLLLLIWVSENPCLGNVKTTPLRRKKRPPSRHNIETFKLLNYLQPTEHTRVSLASNNNNIYIYIYIIENRGIIIEEIRNRKGIEYYGELELGSEYISHFISFCLVALGPRQ